MAAYRLTTVAAALVVSAVVMACGGDDSRQPVPRASTPGPVDDEPAAPARASAEIKKFTFRPGRVVVRRGGRVTWSNRDASNHTVTFDGRRPRDIGNLREGQKGSVQFPQRGQFAYVCAYHPGMAGTVAVR